MPILKYVIHVDDVKGREIAFKNPTIQRVESYLQAMRDYNLNIHTEITTISNLSEVSEKMPKEFQLEIVLADGVDPTPMTEGLRRYGAVLLSDENKE